MQDAREAIATMRLAQHKNAIKVEKDHHRTTRQEHIEALQVAQYLKMKVKCLRGLIARLTIGTHMSIELNGYSPDLERLEIEVLDRALTHEIEEAETDLDNIMPPPSSPPVKRQRRPRGSKETIRTSSDGAIDILQNFSSSQGTTINPADLFSSDSNVMPSSDSTFPSSHWIEPEVIDPELLAEQYLQATEILGPELADTVVAQRVLWKAPLLTRGELLRMRVVLTETVEAREDMFVFARELLGE
ncbi:hypothetical protein LTR62_005080 [Meristemomyces frigidus]|uniref:DUF7071 domain-containing protein n=1 Tax=Meristemomyces frigidus TaxID=1508187 RepID=A0AAN7YKD6_9PEZI|nr:hypothetical protein LTR62_005080 [Meristemomyces frigidus]